MTPRTRSTQPTRAHHVREASALRRATQKRGLRDAILAAAGELLAEDGYADFSLRRLAERIGYSATTVYHHFRDKDDLVLAVMNAGFSLFAGWLRDAVESSDDPVEQLRALGEAYIAFGFEHPLYYRVMFMQRCELWERLDPAQQGDMLCSYDLLKATVQRVIDSGRARAVDVESASCAIWAAVHGVVALGLTMPFIGPDDASAMAETSREIMMNGLLKG